jgi:hypothetical protein
MVIIKSKQMIFSLNLQKKIRSTNTKLFKLLRALRPLNKRLYVWYLTRTSKRKFNGVTLYMRRFLSLFFYFWRNVVLFIVSSPNIPLYPNKYLSFFSKLILIFFELLLLKWKDKEKR